MTKRRFMLIVTMTLTVPLASLAMASSVLASPQGVFSVFSDCPLATIQALGAPPGVALCQYGQITGGELTIGSTKVPIDKTITLRSGAIPTGNPEDSREFFLLPAADGDSLSETEMNIPGGLFDLVNCREIKGRGIAEKITRRTCKAIFESRITGATATVELVASAQDPALFNEFAFNVEEGAANTLPTRVHLRNPLLGNSCYIGSESSPILLHLTTGATSPAAPNESISGSVGETETLEEDEQLALRVTGVSLVDNTFSVPVAEGCGGSLSSIVDPLVDFKLKLPSADGNNTAILDGAFTTSTARAVIASEKFPPSGTHEHTRPEENHHQYPWQGGGRPPQGGSRHTR
jgi:hypothetical protein